jgi:ketosteroid isomerase-like protein
MPSSEQRSRGCSASDRRRMASNATRASVLLKAIEASVAGDSSVVAELYTKDVRGWTPATSVSSSAELAVEIEDRETAFSDVDLDLTALDVSGDQACVEWVATATLSGPLVADDHLIEPTGRRLTLRGVTVADFDGEKICAFRQYVDEAALLEHLGLLAE